ncbi:MAG: ribonuclease H-like domain-containing protein, partial [Bdellovibrionales bacterium]
MLENSFVHLPGIGPGTEEKFWAQGLRTWDHLSDNLNEIFGPRKAQQIAEALEESRQAHESREFTYFQGRFKGAEMWRVLPALLNSECIDQIAYLDIETTGLGFPPQCKSTTIAIYYQGELHLEHNHARKRAILEEINRNAKCLVTFNGGTFDLPFLRREFNMEFRQAHVDLRYWMAKHDYRGGLKAIQQALPNVRQRDSMDIDGFDAVRLWNLHQRGVPNALETLLTYNAEDTVVLEQMIYCGLEMERVLRPQLNLKSFNAPSSPQIPFEICPLVYQMLRR